MNLFFPNSLENQIREQKRICSTKRKKFFFEFQLTWNPPVDNGGCAVQQYVIYMDQNDDQANALTAGIQTPVF
jgi:hypothetical protein